MNLIVDHGVFDSVVYFKAWCQSLWEVCGQLSVLLASTFFFFGGGGGVLHHGLGAAVEGSVVKLTVNRKMKVLRTNSAQSSVMDTEESRHSQAYCCCKAY